MVSLLFADDNNATHNEWSNKYEAFVASCKVSHSPVPVSDPILPFFSGQMIYEPQLDQAISGAKHELANVKKLVLPYASSAIN